MHFITKKFVRKTKNKFYNTRIDCYRIIKLDEGLTSLLSKKQVVARFATTCFFDNEDVIIL